MAKSKETFNKKDKEQRKQRHKQDKLKKAEERKANKRDGNSLDGMMAYLDEYGNITDVPTDPRIKKVYKQEEIQIGVPQQADLPDEFKFGTVSFCNDAKGFGFINDDESRERIFFHYNDILEEIHETDKVQYKISRGPRGLNATEVSKKR